MFVTLLLIAMFPSSNLAHAWLLVNVLYLVLPQAILAEGPIVLPQEKKLVLPKYCESIYQTRRRPTRTIHVSSVLSSTSTALCLPIKTVV
jgi:hypothetical protein